MIPSTATLTGHICRACYRAAVPPETLSGRPALRGYVHLAAAVAAPLLLAILLLIANSPRGYVGAALFGSSALLLFGVSATYHLAPWRPHQRTFVRRIDHATIFVAVAGFYTPFCLQVLGNGWGIPLLSVVGGLALAGVVMSLAVPRAPRWLDLACYLAVGWAALAATIQLADRLDGPAMAAVVLSGAAYTAGGLAYALHWPRLWPRVFGHHELFHVLVTGATASLFVVVAVDVLPR